MDDYINIFGLTADMIFCSVVLFFASLAAEKKQKQGLNMIAEKRLSRTRLQSAR
jgi:hypothetical protein